MNKNLLQLKRKSFMEIDETFLWTATINQWQKLWELDQYKDIVVSSFGLFE